MNLEEAIKKRKSITKYSSKKPDWRKIVQSMDAARYAPNADGTSAIKFLLISNEEKIKELIEATQQSFVGTAKYVVILVSDDSKLVQKYDDRGIRYSSLQAGAAIQNFLLSLTEKKLVTKWVKYFDEGKVKELFGIPENLIIEGIFPIGLETKIKTLEEKKTRLETLVYFEKWGNSKMTPHTMVSLENT